jgi:hypothetical protein
MEVLTVIEQEIRDLQLYEARLDYHRYQASLLREICESKRRVIEARILQPDKGPLFLELRVLRRMLKLPEIPKDELDRFSWEELAAMHGKLVKQLLPDGE